MTNERNTFETNVAILRELVSRQAEDHGLWFNAKTAPEAYLQQELRKLHTAIEALPTEPAETEVENWYADGRRHACAAILRHLLTQMRVDQSRPEIQDLFK